MCIPVLQKMSSITATNVLFIIVNISMEYIHLRNGEIIAFIGPTDINSNDFTTEVYEAVFKTKTPHLM